MVSSISMLFMAITALISLVMPIAVIIGFRSKRRFSFKAFGLGIAVFIVFSQILEKLMHLYILAVNKQTSSFMNHHPIIMGLYGAIAAGLFEEIGRFLAYRYFFVEKRLSWSDGISYGTGHGGMEAVLLGTFGGIQQLVMAVLINSGRFTSSMGAHISSSAVETIRSHLVAQPSYYFALGGVERICAFLIQLALSLIVLYGVRSGKLKYLAYAIALHALVDFLPGLNQTMQLNIWLVEAVVVVFGILAGIFVVQSRKRLSVPAG